MGKIFSCAAILASVALASSIAFAKDPSIKKLRRAPAKIAVAGATMELEGRIWRDPPDSAPLEAALKLKTTNNVSLPPGIEVTRVWLVGKKEVWSPEKYEAEIEVVEPGQPRSVMNITFGAGPKWKPGTKVICVARITMTDGSEGLLKSGKIVIANSVR